MAIIYTKQLNGVKVYPELDGNNNVIRVVNWTVHFFDEANPEVKTEGQIETILPPPAVGFTPIEDLTQEEILGWAFATQGGDEFIEAALREHHEDVLSYLTMVHGVQDFDINTIN